MRGSPYLGVMLLFAFWYFHLYDVLFSCVVTYLLPKFCSAERSTTIRLVGLTYLPT
jgi:hypothetical protein